MKSQLLKLTFAFLLALFSGTASAQEDEPKTIKIKRESNLAKVVFDNTELKLIVVDRFGNPKENRIMAYKLYVKGQRDTEEFSGHSNRLNSEMIKCLNGQNKATKIFFTGISAEDDNGHLVKLPDVVEVWFPDCRNCDKQRKKR